MPGNVTSGQGKLTYVTIADFTPGIQNQAYTTAPSGSIYANPLNTPSLQGVSASPNSYGCVGLPNGGLLLGPTVFSVTSNIFTWPGSTPSTPVVSGVTSGSGVYFNDWFIIVNGEISGTYWTFVFDLNATPPLPALYAEPDTYDPPSLGTSRPSFPFITTLLDSNTPLAYLIANSPSSAMCWWFQQSSHGTIQTDHYGYPIPANGRIWFVGSNEGSFGGVASVTGTPIYNAISYTDPSAPNPDGDAVTNLTIGDQATLVDYDDPSGFGAWGTITSGETMLIKSSPNGGGVLVTGDIYSPNVYKAPAVQGTNGMQGIACQSPLGLIYRSYANGVWAWDGGAQSTKISAQLSDSLWPENAGADGIVVSPISPFNSNTNALAYNFFNCQYINNFILFDGGFFYDIATNSWGRLPPYASAGSFEGTFYPCFYVQNINSPSQFSAVYASGSNGTLINYAMDVSAGDVTFTPPEGFYGSFWASNPINIADGNIVEIQNIEIVIQGSGFLTVTASNPYYEGDDNVGTYEATVSADSGYKRIVFNCKFTTDVIQIAVGWTNATGSTHATPIIDNIKFGYIDRFPAPKVGGS